MEEDLHEGVMNTAALIDHEMFASWVAAGFKEHQAMQLLLQAKAIAQGQIYNDEFHAKHCPDCLGE